MDKIERIKELIFILSKASVDYYKYDRPTMSDKQYDDLYDELECLEKETGIIMSNSPTQKVQGFVLDGLKKVKHDKPMLSANKTKSIEEIRRFIGDKKCVMSWKEDGLTIVLWYKDGVLDKAITRGQDGVIGEDVTHTMKMCKNIPFKLPHCVNLKTRGECLISWDEFNRINEELDEPYKHPRNLAAGTVRQLDANIAKDRNIEYKAFELIQDEMWEQSKEDAYLSEHLMDTEESFNYLSECGFDVVEHAVVTAKNFEEEINRFNPNEYGYPVDGLIFTYDDFKYGKLLGETTHHPLNMIALKWEDDLYETVLIDIKWQTSKTGLINPVAVFEPVDLDGAETTNATLHNLTYIEDLELGIGDTIQVYRANRVIPKVHDNLTRSNTWKYPDKCPVCGAKTEVHNENGSKTLHCTGDGCKGKLLGRLNTFVSKKGMNIDGLSEETLSKFVDIGWIKNLFDIYGNLHLHYSELINMGGFGKRSVEKLDAAIEKSKDVELKNFVASLSIPGIGSSQSKELAKNFTWDEFQEAGFGNYDFSELVGFGEVLNRNIHEWFKTMWDEDQIGQLVRNVRFKENKSMNIIHSNDLSGMVFVITGSLNHFTNRDEAKEWIEAFGGKVSGTVSSKTSYLVNNDVSSTSGKNKKAKNLGIPIISEAQLLEIAQ